MIGRRKRRNTIAMGKIIKFHKMTSKKCSGNKPVNENNVKREDQ